jgi:hypothetical protein
MTHTTLTTTTTTTTAAVILRAARIASQLLRPPVLVEVFNQYRDGGLSSKLGSYHSSNRGTGSAPLLEAVNWVVATATRSSGTKTEMDDVTARRK